MLSHVWKGGLWRTLIKTRSGAARMFNMPSVVERTSASRKPYSTEFAMFNVRGDRDPLSCLKNRSPGSRSA